MRPTLVALGLATLGLGAPAAAPLLAQQPGPRAARAAQAAPDPAPIGPEEYAARRAALARAVGDGVVLAFGGRYPVDDDGAFRQLPGFRYLTGYDEPDAALLLVARRGRPALAMLYEPARDPRRMLYDGFPTDSAELAARIGLGIRTLEHLRPAVDSLVRGGLPLHHLPDVESRDYIGQDSLTRGSRFLERLRAERPGVQVRDAQAPLDALRVRKSPAEVALLRRAIDITTEAHLRAMREVAPGKNEGEVEAAIDYTFRAAGGEGRAFRSIIGSGPNSTSYHYRRNDRVMRAGEVVVMDIGALYRGYAADVTRTVPVSGVFTPEQREVYGIVRQAQAAAEREARPGARVQAGTDAARRVIAAGLARLGLTESAEATFDPPWAASCGRRPDMCRQDFLYMAHGLGHGIGLEVHDVGGYSYSPSGVFQEGEVFSIEPGIYISTTLLDMLPDTPRNRAFIARVRPTVERYRDIGVRIEDDYVVTASGVEWLSRAPREVAEVEAAMRGRPRT